MPSSILPIPDFPGYFADDQGNIYSMKQQHRSGGRPYRLRPASRRGQMCVSLVRNGIKHDQLVHRLVLRTFVGECPAGMEGCHNDGNHSNNQQLNLRWDTRQANCEDCVAHGRHTKEVKRKVTPAVAEKIASMAGSHSKRRIAELLDLSPRTIQRYLRTSPQE